MGQTGFCENIRFSCENLQFPAVFCENLRFRDAVIPRKNKNLQKSARICEKLRIWLLFPLIPPVLVLSSKNWKTYSRWGAVSKINPKSLGLHFHSVAVRQYRCRFSESADFSFSQASTSLV